MEVMPILAPSGDPVFAMGGRLAHHTAEYKSLRISLEWIKRGRKFVRVLCIWPASKVEYQRGVTAAGAWVIADTAIVHFLDFDKDGVSTGKPSNFLFEEARKALEPMGKDPNDKAALFELVDCVMRWGPELGTQPAAPRHVQIALAQEAMWDMEVQEQASGKTIRESEV